MVKQFREIVAAEAVEKAKELVADQERFKQDLLLMGATEEEVTEQYNKVWGKKDIKAQMIEEMKKTYPSLDEYCTGKYFQARTIKAEQPQHTHTDWYEINGVSRSDFF